MEAIEELPSSIPQPSSKEVVESIDDMMEKGLGRFGWLEVMQCILVSLASFFDAQQSFITIYTEDYPTWHCTNSTLCNSDSNICNIPKSSWSWDGPSHKTVISQWSLECASSFITGLPQSSFFMGCLFAFKFFIGFLRSSIGTCVLVLLMEKVSTKWRFTVGWALKRMVAVMVLGIGIGMVYFGMPLAVGNLGFDIYLAVVFSALMEIPACVATYFLENRQRKPSILVFSVASGVCCIMCVVVGPGIQEIRVGLAMTSFFCACTAFNVFLIYVLELFPTSVRNTTTSLVRQAMNFGNIFTPFLISAGRKNDIYSYGVFGVVVMLSCFTLIGLPETRGLALCDTMDQQEKKDDMSV
ncbi:unnamed protein product [Vicia faba]|uniref:Uncharacterized protein n=1 Tax=Vicia faba TaxID=3906 RepID=A0AAV0ZTK0_VICFA|nr:unnamed protein product [Vicia faba]